VIYRNASGYWAEAGTDDGTDEIIQKIFEKSDPELYIRLSSSGAGGREFDSALLSGD
jgi:hypothetical protein